MHRPDRLVPDLEIREGDTVSIGYPNGVRWLVSQYEVASSLPFQWGGPRRSYQSRQLVSRFRHLAYSVPPCTPRRKTGDKFQKPSNSITILDWRDFENAIFP